jgi:hypothetical protein
MQLLHDLIFGILDYACQKFKASSLVRCGENSQLLRLMFTVSEISQSLRKTVMCYHFKFGGKICPQTASSFYTLSFDIPYHWKRQNTTIGKICPQTASSFYTLKKYMLWNEGRL